MRGGLLLILTSALIYAATTAADDLSGRWEGSIEIPGREVNLIIDLDHTDGASGKDWAGSIIPGLGVKGAQLSELAVKNAGISCAIDGALGSERTGKAKLNGGLNGAGQLTGNFLQAGNSAPFKLRKTGPAQVELPRKSTPVSKILEGEWKGDFEMPGYPRHVTLTLSNPAPDHATAQFVIVGKRTTNAPVDLVMEENGLLTIESRDFGITYEGRMRKDGSEIEGTISLGAFELPLVLRRTP